VATYTFSTLAHNQHLGFDPEADVLNFDAAGISASEVRIVRVGDNLGLSHGGKTVWLDGTRMEDLSIGSLGFADDSGAVFGDGSANPRLDWYGAEYTLGTVTEDVQAWGLGGADLVTTGSGDDWLVGNVALAPLNHVSRSGSTGAPTASNHASVSADGNLVAFAGGWTAFGSTNNNGTDVFVKNVTSGAVSNEHRDEEGDNGSSGAGSPVISADGSVVAFLSASDLTDDAPSSGGLYDIFLAEVGGSGITMVSTGTGGTPAADGRSLNPDLSFDGSSIVFESTTSNWAAGGSTATADVFLKDLSDGSLTRISTSTGGADGNGESLNAKVSADGRYVVFESDASNLTSGDTNGYRDIFLWDRDAAGNKLTNLTEGAAARNPNNTATDADIAYDEDADGGAYGGVVVFQTARAFVDADTANNTDIYAYDLAAGTFTLVSSTADGTGVQLSSEDASISGDGRFVVFTSYSDALVAGDANGTRDVFVKDLYTGRIALVSQSATGEAADGPSLNAQISLGGEWIVFESSAGNLAASDANGGFSDVYRVSNPLLTDTLRGGAGDDTYVLARADTVRESANAGTDTVLSSISYTLGANVENLTLTGSSNLSGTGNGLNNVITGNAGHNKLNGAGGVDTVSYAAAGNAVTVSLAVATAQVTGAGSDTLSNFENLTGSAYADRLTGNGGNNRIDGRAGGDTMIGGLGDDTYVADVNSDVVTEAAAAGTDTVISAVNWTLGATLENLTLSGSAATTGRGNSAANVINGNGIANTLTGAAGNDTLAGGAGNDNLAGNTGNDRLDGGVGNDTATGGTGDDTYVTDAAGDVIVELPSEGTDTVVSAVNWTLGATLENLTLSGSTATTGRGNSAANVVTGNGIANTLTGGAGNDTIAGGTGSDTITGGAGADALNGGSGADVFVLDSKVGSDTIVGFSSGTDDLRISRAGVPVGDGDAVLEGAVTRAAAGGFARTAELVVFTANAGALTTGAAADAIGSATSAYAAGATALFAIDNGSSSALYLFTSSGANATVSASELTLLATLSGTASTVVADYAFGA
jgi:Ca2+-binding RTX toxin-like protein